MATPGAARPAPPVPGTAHPIWRRGFRPFFLGAGLFGGGFVLAWTAVWRGWLPAPAWLAPSLWHAHEMIFGLVAAAVAGFLLTSTPVWTGRPALAGRPLMALAALWAAGRAVMLAAGLAGAGLVAAVDAAFLPALAFVLARTVWGSGQRRNYGVVALVGVLAAANAVVHAEALGLVTGWAPRALRFAVDVVIVLIVVIGGRITPPFTGNALLRLGITAPVRQPAWAGPLAIGAALLVVVMDLAQPGGWFGGAAACAAAAAVALRMAGWQTLRTWRDPLVWSLHAGMAWVVAGYLLVGIGGISGAVAPTAGLHALTAGAMGSMILAVMTRVGLGHTGRPLDLPAGAVGTYVLVHAGAAARVASAVAPAPAQPALLLLAGVLWAAAFWLYAALYWPILTRARVDGKDG